MDKIQQIKSEYRLKTWSEMYREYQVSGMTVKDWCAERQLSTKTFYYRLRRLREAALERAEPRLEKSELHEIVPVSLPTADSNLFSKVEEQKIKIVGSGISIELPTDVSPKMMAAILRGLKS